MNTVQLYGQSVNLYFKLVYLEITWTISNHSMLQTTKKDKWAVKPIPTTSRWLFIYLIVTSLQCQSGHHHIILGTKLHNWTCAVFYSSFKHFIADGVLKPNGLAIWHLTEFKMIPTVVYCTCMRTLKPTLLVTTWYNYFNWVT